MNGPVRAAATLLAAAFLALPIATLADKPDPNRDPSGKGHGGVKQCDFIALTACGIGGHNPWLEPTDIKDAYDLVKTTIDNQNNGGFVVFLSGNPDRDAGSLLCKISGAEFKLYQDKADEAWYLFEDAIAKIATLEAQGKLDPDARSAFQAFFESAQDCINDPPNLSAVKNYTSSGSW